MFRRARRTFVLMVWALLALAVLAAGPAPAFAAEYFVSPDGDDARDGSSPEKAFRSIDRAAKLARSGDAVNIAPGTYVGRIRPAHSGSSPERVRRSLKGPGPIIFRNAATRGLAEVDPDRNPVIITTSKETDGGRWEERAALKLGKGNNYFIFDGLTFRDCESWIYLGEHAHHNTFRNCTFERNRMYHGIFLDSASWTTISNCRFLAAVPYPDGWEGATTAPALADYISIWRDSHHNLVEGCQFNHITHVCVCIMGRDPDTTATCNIVRNCTFNEPYWKCVSFHSSRNTLVEGCTMWGKAASFFQYQAADAIVRHNVIRDYQRVRGEANPSDYTGALWLRSVISEYGCLDDARNGRIYNNTFYNNEKAITYGARTTNLPVCENVFKNNIFVGTREPLRLPRPFFANWSTQNANYFTNNVIMGTAPGQKVIEYLTVQERLPLTLAEAVAKSRELCRRQLFEGNLEVDPRFVNAEKHDFRLAEGSPCIDAGAALTHTVDDGQGTEVIVADPRYFCDGYGVIEGDRVVVGRNEPARVVEVDVTRRLLRLDRAIAWKKDDPVNLPFVGAAPDIGACEFGAE